MESQKSITDNILKQESVGYLKSKLNFQQGTLIMTNNKISLTAHKAGVSGFGILGFFLKNILEKVKTFFDLEFSDINSVREGKHGLQKNVLEITDKQNVSYRMMVKNYQEWENAINKKCKLSIKKSSTAL